MKRFLYGIALLAMLVVGSGVTPAPSAKAAVSKTGKGGGVTTLLEGGLKTAAGAYNQERTDIRVIIGSLINVALGFLGVLLLFYFLYGGFLWMTAEGEDAKVKKARDMIKNAVIGIVIVTAAFILSNEVLRGLRTAFEGDTEKASDPYVE